MCVCTTYACKKMKANLSLNGMKNHTKHKRYFINAESELCGGLTLLDLRVLGRELEGSQMYSYYVHIISYKFGENLSIG